MSLRAAAPGAAALPLSGAGAGRGPAKRANLPLWLLFCGGEKGGEAVYFAILGQPGGRLCPMFKK